MAKYLTLIILALDQMSKALIRIYLPLGAELSLIPGFFSLQQTRNSGAAWGFLGSHGWGIYFLSLVSIIMSILIYYVYRDLESGLLKLSLSILLGGAVGNLIDRLFLGEVVDFLSFRFGIYNFPNFNLADSAICIAAALLIYIMIFKSDELSKLKFLEEKEQN